MNERRRAVGLTYERFAELLGITPAGVKKLMNGEAAHQYAKLGTLASVLQTTPNELLGFRAGYDIDVVKAILESTFQTLGENPSRAIALAELVLELLHAPPIQSAKLEPSIAARIQAELAIRHYLKTDPA